MFYYISGQLACTMPQTAVVDCGGVGYRLTISETTYSKLPLPGGNVRLYTYMSVREDAVELFGFGTEEELRMFSLLITVSGVGPKVALSVLSRFTCDTLAAAVSRNDIKALSKASGVGAKTAARIILELKEKIAKEFTPTGEDDSGENNYTSGGNPGNAEEAVSALMVLGYSAKEASEALEGLDTGEPLETLVTKALRKLGMRI